MSSLRPIQEQDQVNLEAQNTKDGQKNETIKELFDTLGASEDQSNQNEVNEQKDMNNNLEISQLNCQQNQQQSIETNELNELKSAKNEKINMEQNQLGAEEFKNSDQMQNDCSFQDQKQLNGEKVQVKQQNEDAKIETDNQKVCIQNDVENQQQINQQNQQNSTQQQVHLKYQQDIQKDDLQLPVTVQQEQTQNLEKENLLQNEAITNNLLEDQKNQEKLSQNEQDYFIQPQNENNVKDEQQIVSKEQNEIEKQKLEYEQTQNKIEQYQPNNLENHGIVQKEHEQSLCQQNVDNSLQNPDQVFSNEDNQCCDQQIKIIVDQLSLTGILEQSGEERIETKEQILDNLQILQDIQDVNQQQKDPNYHLLQESKSVEDLKCLLDNQKNDQAKKSKKKKQRSTSKNVIQRSELSNFLKKHDLVSSKNLSEKEAGQNKKLQNKIQRKSIEHQSKTAIKTQKPNLFPILKDEKKQIYRFCRDPYNQRFNQKILQKRKFFSILNLNLFKYKIECVFSFLNDKEIFKLRLVSKAFQPYLLSYFEQNKQQAIQKAICHKKAEISQIKDRINKSEYYSQKIKKLTEQINENISHLYVYLYFDKLNVKSLSVNEVKLLKLFYEALVTKPSIINSLQILNYCAKKEEVTSLFGNLTLSYDYMDKKLQEQFYSELQLIVDFIKINNSAIVPSILENQIFTFSQEMIKKVESNIYIDKTYSSNILKGIYYWFELQLFYNQFLEKEPAFFELNKNQELINYLKHTYEINHYLLKKKI